VWITTDEPLSVVIVTAMLTTFDSVYSDALLLKCVQHSVWLLYFITGM